MGSANWFDARALQAGRMLRRSPLPSILAEMALMQAWALVVLEAAPKGAAHEIHPSYAGDRSCCSRRGSAPSRSANVSKVSRQEACLMPGNASACGSTRCSRKGGLRGNNWERAVEVE